ncbi:MAG TPA: pyridoxal-phosphate dependent enzyme [Streptosporangiaceae bacterium]|jgi:threonine dehydratase
MIDIADISAAAERITGHVIRTPAIVSPGLSQALGVPVTAKLELLQHTGSFKARGAVARLLALSPAERACGVVAVSGGNHGIAVAIMAGALDIKATVVMPQSASRRAVRIAQGAGAVVRLTDGMPEAFALTERLRNEGMVLVHPFDDPVVVAAQGTVGLEFAEDAGELTDVLVSIGGGGLISGIAAALHALRPQVRVWGVETQGADAMSRALAAGAPVPAELSSIVTTLSAPMVSPLTYEHVAALVHEVIVVSDRQAVAGVLEIADQAKLWTEPATGCLMAAARQVIERVGDGIALGLVICGGNAAFADVRAWADDFGLE